MGFGLLRDIKMHINIIQLSKNWRNDNEKSIYSVAKALIILFLLAFVLHIVASVLFDGLLRYHSHQKLFPIMIMQNLSSTKRCRYLTQTLNILVTQQTISTCLILPCHFLGILPPYQVTFPWEQMPISYVLFILIVIKINSIM